MFPTPAKSQMASEEKLDKWFELKVNTKTLKKIYFWKLGQNKKMKSKCKRVSKQLQLNDIETTFYHCNLYKKIQWLKINIPDISVWFPFLCTCFDKMKRKKILLYCPVYLKQVSKVFCIVKVASDDF